MLGTRPDLAFAVSRLCQYQSNPSEQHLAYARHVLQYLRGTSSLRLCLGSNDNGEAPLVGYTDADYAGDTDNSRSTSGWVYYLGRGAVCWSSQKQNSVSSGTFDSEYFAASEACKQFKWLHHFATQIEHPLDLPIVLNCDNKSAVDASKTPNVKHRTKHVRVRAHLVHECFDQGEVILTRIPGVDNPADIFTKALKEDVFKRHAKSLGLV